MSYTSKMAQSHLTSWRSSFIKLTYHLQHKPLLPALEHHPTAEALQWKAETGSSVTEQSEKQRKYVFNVDCFLFFKKIFHSFKSFKQVRFQPGWCRAQAAPAEASGRQQEWGFEDLGASKLLATLEAGAPAWWPWLPAPVLSTWTPRKRIKRNQKDVIFRLLPDTTFYLAESGFMD